MQRWEYLTIRLTDGRWVSDCGGVFVPGTRVLDSVGADGWELIGAGFTETKFSCYILKRPVPEPHLAASELRERRTQWEQSESAAQVDVTVSFEPVAEEYLRCPKCGKRTRHINGFTDSPNWRCDGVGACYQLSGASDWLRANVTPAAVRTPAELVAALKRLKRDTGQWVAHYAVHRELEVLISRIPELADGR